MKGIFEFQQFIMTTMHQAVIQGSAEKQMEEFTQNDFHTFYSHYS